MLRLLFQKAVPNVVWADGQPVPCSQSPGRRLNTKAVSTHYPNPYESGWFVFTIFITSEELYHVPFPSPYRFLNVLFALSGVSCVGWSILCPTCPLGLMVSTSTCIQGPILSCCVGLCNLCVKTYTHLLIHLKVVRIIYWALIAKWKEKTKCKDVNMLVIEVM